MLPNLTHWTQNDRQPEFTAVCRWNMERETCNRLTFEIERGLAITVPPAGGCQNSSKPGTLQYASRRFARFQFPAKVFLRVFLSSVHLRDTRLTLNVTATVSVYFCNSNQTKSFDISWTSDALLYFLPTVCISSMDWNIYYLCLFVAFHAFNSSFLWSVLFFFPHVFCHKKTTKA